MKFKPSMHSLSKINKSFLKNPDFNLDVLDAVDKTKEDGKTRLIGNMVERFIIEKSEVTNNVRILMITGFQVFVEDERDNK